MANDYKDTLFLPKTDFPMRANLSQREPEFLKFWYDIDVYGELKKKNKDKPSFILHDGPPYANASIHIGTATNKILKDFIVKYKWQRGYFTPYVPGYDTHGLPIELKVLKELNVGKDEISPVELRQKCAAYARSAPRRHRRLGASVHDARPCVRGDGARRPRRNGGQGARLQGTQGDLLVHRLPDGARRGGNRVRRHGFYECGGKVYLIAVGLKAEVEKATGLELGEPVLVCKGQQLELSLAKHPFYDRAVPFVLADYVTLDSGTGCVHTAPGHGSDDYETGVRYGIEVYNPVDPTGHYYADTPIFGGMSLAEGEKKVFELLEESRRLLGKLKITHSYPHCWRCKKPVIFRATDQWFVAVSEFRDQALKCIDEVKWIPDWGKDRITNMVRDRSDWCISRQRTWGVPIPAFYCEDCGEVILTGDRVRRVAEKVREHGSDCWWTMTPDASTAATAGGR